MILWILNRQAKIFLRGIFSKTKIVISGWYKWSNTLENLIIHYFAEDTHLLYGNKIPYVISDDSE